MSFVGPKIALKIFLSKTPKTASSHFDNTHVSEPYVSTGLIKVLYHFILFFMIIKTQMLIDVLVFGCNFQYLFMLYI